MSQNPEEDFRILRNNQIRDLTANTELQSESRNWLTRVAEYGYTYNFDWLGRPIIQLPQDIVAIQEIIWKVKPDVIIETGVAHGGSATLHASLLSLLDLFDSWNSSQATFRVKRKVVAIEIELRKHNKYAIEQHPLHRYIDLIEGSSTDPNVLEKVNDSVGQAKCVMVVLDSNHTHEHVLSELNLYSKFVTKDSYLIVMDTGIEDAPDNHFPNKPWGKGNNPKTAVFEFLKNNKEFFADTEIDGKLQVTVAPSGYLKKFR